MKKKKWRFASWSYQPIFPSIWNFILFSYLTVNILSQPNFIFNISKNIVCQMRTIFWFSTLLSLALFLPFRAWVKYLVPKDIELLSKSVGIKQLFNSPNIWRNNPIHSPIKSLFITKVVCCQWLTKHRWCSLPLRNEMLSPEWTASYENIQSTVCSKHAAPVTHLLKCLIKETEKKIVSLCLQEHT